MTKTAGWEITNKELNEGLYLLTIEMISLSPINSISGIRHRASKTSNLFTFDHDPSNNEIETTLEEYGFNPELEEVSGDRLINKIRIDTDSEQQFGYDFQNNTEDYLNIMGLVPIAIDKNPGYVILKGDWIYLYYTREDTNYPKQFFSTKHILYSVRIHKDTGETKRKGYDFDLTISDTVKNSLEGFNDINHIIGTGHFYDEDRVTVYYLAEALGEDVANPLLNVLTPFYGITWEGNNKLYNRYYHRVPI